MFFFNFLNVKIIIVYLNICLFIEHVSSRIEMWKYRIGVKRQRQFLKIKKMHSLNIYCRSDKMFSLEYNIREGRETELAEEHPKFRDHGHQHHRDSNRLLRSSAYIGIAQIVWWLFGICRPLFIAYRTIRNHLERGITANQARSRVSIIPDKAREGPKGTGTPERNEPWT